MSAIIKLLDKAQEQCSPANQTGLALRLGVTRGAISSWKTQAYPLPTERIAELARIAHLDAGEWVVLVEAEQSKGEAKKTYGLLAKRLGIAALLGLFTTPAWAGNAGHAVGISVAQIVFTVGIMRNKARDRAKEIFHYLGWSKSSRKHDPFAREVFAC